MEPTAEDLSPEEKLLRVIQGGDAKAKAGGTAPDPEAPPVVQTSPLPAAAPAAQPPAPKPPKLKLATPPPAAAAAAAREPPKAAVAQPAKKEDKKPEPPASPAAPAAAAPAPAPVPPKGEKEQEKKEQKAKPARPAASAAPRTAGRGKQKEVQPGSRIRLANRFLAGVVAVMLCLCGLEIWVGARAGAAVSPPPEQGGETAVEPRAAFTPLEVLQKAFEEKQIWDLAEQAAPPVATSATVQAEGPPTEEVLKLIGLSRRPGVPLDQAVAVILDNAAGRMNFLKQGEKLAFHNRQFTVQEIFSDRVVIADGDVKFTIK